MGKIYILGLGGSDYEQLPLKALNFIEHFDTIYLRTADHPVVNRLKENKKKQWISFDHLYDELNEDFEKVYLQIVDKLIDLAESQDILYAVPGHPIVAERTVQLLLNSDQEIEIIGGHSFIDDLLTATGVDPIEGFQLLDAFSLSSQQIVPTQHVFVAQIAHSYIASLAKLELLKVYPAEHLVQMIDAAGSRDESSEWMPLYTIDFFEGVHNLRTLYIPPLSRDEAVFSFSTLIDYSDEIFDLEEGDAWLKEQSIESLLPYFQEELNEYKEAVKKDDITNQIEELGDLLMQCVYQVKMAEREELFGLEDVLASINQKVRRRHPHVFDGVSAKTPEEVDALWQAIKEKEKEDDYAD